MNQPRKPTSVVVTLRVALAVVLLAIGYNPFSAWGQSELRWKWREGDVLRYELEQVNTTHLLLQGQDFESPSKLTLGWTWTVESVSEAGVASIVQTVDYAHGEVRIGPESLRFDTRRDLPVYMRRVPETLDPRGLANGVVSLYSRLIGKPWKLTLGPTGAILEVDAPPGLEDVLRGSPAFEMAETGSVFSPEGLQNLLAQAMPPLPTQAVGKGDRWVSEVSLPAGPLILTVKSHTELAGIEQAQARMTSQLDLTLKAREGSNLKVELREHAGSRSSSFDLEKGMLQNSDLNHTFALVLSATDVVVNERIELRMRVRLLEFR